VIWIRAAFEWQSRAVLHRHLRVYLRSWYTNFLPPATEPVLMLLAFGLGLGGYVPEVRWHDRDLAYMTFVGPGMLAYATFMTASFQSLYAAFIRMRYQRTWEGQLTSQIELPHVVWGEVLWAALLATTYAAIVSAVLTVCRALGLLQFDLGPLPLLLPLSFLAGCDFPLPVGIASTLAWANPVYHLAETYRALLLGGAFAPHLLALAGSAAAMVAVLVPLDMVLLRRRVLGD
jgi:lipooligosaccharide transport system permease protein